MSESREALEDRAQRAILQNAFMRWESALALATAILLPIMLTVADTSIFSIPNWSWLIVGIAAYLGLAYSSLTDDEGNQKVVAQLLRDEFDPDKIKKPQLKAKIQEALDYRTRITELINNRKESTIKIQLAQMATQFDDWVEEIYDLATRLDAYERELPLLKHSYDGGKKRITKLTKRLNSVRDQATKDDITKNINALNRKLDTIEALHHTMGRAELRLDNTLTAMGTIYPQTLLLSAKDIDSSRYKRLQQEIADEVDELADVLYAMDEVYSDSEI